MLGCCPQVCGQIGFPLTESLHEKHCMAEVLLFLSSEKDFFQPKGFFENLAAAAERMSLLPNLNFPSFRNTVFC